LQWFWVIAVLAVSLATVWIALGAMEHWNGARAVAWILFVAIAFWSGALAFIGALGAKAVQMESVVVKQKSNPVALSGLFIGQTAQEVYIASRANCDVADCRRVLAISGADVACVAFGPQQDVAKARTVDPGLADFMSAGIRADPCTRNPKSAASTATPDPQPPPAGVVEPPPPPTPSREIELVLDSDLLFRFGSATLTSTAQIQLRSAARALRQAHASHVWVAGHTDSKGSRPHNQVLSQRRAETVKDALIRALRPARPAISARGYGETKPLACNARPDGSDDWVARAYNRRVEIWGAQAPRYVRLHCPRGSS
jgi:outer membrane protein OmpA-like peptidoglycan-associated protein